MKYQLCHSMALWLASFGTKENMMLVFRLSFLSQKSVTLIYMSRGFFDSAIKQ